MRGIPDDGDGDEAVAPAARLVLHYPPHVNTAKGASSLRAWKICQSAGEEACKGSGMAKVSTLSPKVRRVVAGYIDAVVFDLLHNRSPKRHEIKQRVGGGSLLAPRRCQSSG